MRKTALLTAVAATVLGCGEREAPVVEEGPSGADSVAMAASQFTAAAFDTIEWESRQAALDRGVTVFNFSCMKCHGAEGKGDGEFVTQGDTLRPPDITEPEWRFAQDHEGLREQIYTGTAEGMPHWGLEGLRYRDIDAVATYMRYGLRN
jgi:mono/diheme cytochrome c family protein